MVIEHEFVTTEPESVVLRRVGEYLLAAGFRLASQSSFSIGAEPRVRYRRELRKATNAKKLSDFPQEVLVEFDRGRVTLAVFIESYHQGVRPDTHPKVQPHRVYAESLARLLESVAVGADAANDWDDLERVIASYRQSRMTPAVIVALIIFGALVVIVAVAAVIGSTR